MRYFKIYLLLVIIAICTGCEKDETPGRYNAREVKIFASMGVHLTSLEQTKATVNGIIGNGTNESLTIGIVRMDEKVHESWPYFRSENSSNSLVPLTAELGLPDTDESNIRIVTSFKNGKNDAPQFYMNSQDSVRYAAWYPSTGTFYSTEDSTTIKFNIPAEGNMDIMYAEPVGGKMGPGFDIMKFKHALSLFRIHVYKNTSLDWGNVKSVTLSDMPNFCTVTLPHDLDNNTCSIEYSVEGTADTMRHTCEVPIVQGIDNKILVKEWIAAPSHRDNGLKTLSIAVVTEGGANNTAGTYNLAIGQNFLPGYAYDIVIRFSDSGTVNAEVKVEDWNNGENINSDISVSGTFYDLSSTGTANCYIVSSANFAYCFNATVKGNGNTVALGGGIETSLSPKTVEIVWIDEAVKNDFVLETASVVNGVTIGKIVEGKVLFRVIGAKDESGNVIKSDKSLKNEGNVLLGVRDAAGNMLWTWHIWITDKPQKQNYTKGYIALDRNLGATAASPTGTGTMNGLFYQWGRPTPFRLKKNVNDSLVVDATDSQTHVTPDNAVANPKTFYGTFHYHNQHYTHDWVDRAVFQNINNLWGYREVEHSQPVKTIYDPCPVGYHVPYHRSWELMEQFWSEAEKYADKTTDADKAAFWKTLNGIEFIIEGNSIWYPFQGYINVNGKYKQGHIHKHDNTSYRHTDVPIVENWSSLINRHDADDAKLPVGIDERINDSPYRLQFSRDYLAKLSEDGEYTNRTRGLAVRCVSDNTADVVKDLSASQTANCYMVHENGFYKFKATVRGNGVGSLLPLGGQTTAEINGGLSTTISPVKVDILWWQGDFTNGTIDFPEKEIKSQDDAPGNMCINLLDDGIVTSDGYVAFQIKNFKKGNTILAAYDNAGNILWTWHIWLTDKPQDKISGNYTKMDRFLGATYAPSIPGTNNTKISWPNGGIQATFGFYYQWGKKDPIIGPPSINDESITENGNTAASAGWWLKNKDNGKWQYRKTIDVKDAALIPDVVKDPTAFYKSTTEASAKTSQWFPETFADGYTNVALWGYAVADYSAIGQTFSKTMHDPCPPGYRTPFHFSWRYNSSEKYAEGDDGEAITNLGTAETGFSNGEGFVTNKTHFEKMWFPYAGYRDPRTGSYKNVGINGYMNTGMPMGQYNTRSFWYGKYNNTYSTGQYAGRHGSAYGKMIRCMKE